MPLRLVLFKATIYPHPKEQITLHPLWAQTWETSTYHNHAATSNVTGAGVVSEGTHCVPHPATAAALTALQPTDANITTHAMTHPTGIVTPHPTLTTSPGNITHTTVLLTRASLTPATLTTQHGKHRQGESQAMPKTFNPHKSHHSKAVIIQDSQSDSSSDSEDSGPLNY